jgi:hypothetical protein
VLCIVRASAPNLSCISGISVPLQAGRIASHLLPRVRRTERHPLRAARSDTGPICGGHGGATPRAGWRGWPRPRVRGAQPRKHHARLGPSLHAPQVSGCVYLWHGACRFERAPPGGGNPDGSCVRAWRGGIHLPDAWCVPIRGALPLRLPAGEPARFPSPLRSPLSPPQAGERMWLAVRAAGAHASAARCGWRQE